MLGASRVSKRSFDESNLRLEFSHYVKTNLNGSDIAELNHLWSQDVIYCI